MTGATCVRYADGVTPYLVNGSIVQPDCAADNTCKYGLISYFQVLQNSFIYIIIMLYNAILFSTVCYYVGHRSVTI